MNQSSSDMIDIQIEESLVRETLMSIDSSNFQDDIITLLCFFGILLLSVLLGIFGSPAISSHMTFRPISNNSIVEHFSSFSKKITPYYRFLSFSILMIPIQSSNSVQDSDQLLSFQYQIECKQNDNFILRKIDRSFTDIKIHSILSPENKIDKDIEKKNKKQFLHIFYDKIYSSDFDSIAVHIKFQQAQRYFSQFALRTEIGLPSHTVFQIYFRIVFSFFQLMFLLLLFFRLRVMPIKLWHLEQKLTVPLLIISILYDNPLYFLRYISSKTSKQSSTPSIPPLPPFSETTEIIISSLFDAYFNFFLLVIFDSLRFKNRKIDRCFFGPKIFFFIINAAIYIISGLRSDISKYDIYHKNQISTSNSFFSFFSSGFTLDKLLKIDPLKPNVPIIIFLIGSAYFVWLVYSISNASCKVDITERYKFNMYFTSTCISLALLFIVKILHFLQLTPFFRYTSLCFVTEFIVKNVFALLMAYFHWPYEVLQDQQYIDSADDNSSVMPGDLFNSDDDM